MFEYISCAFCYADGVIKMLSCKHRTVHFGKATDALLGFDNKIYVDAIDDMQCSSCREF
jgi:hypothetical protein